MSDTVRKTWDFFISYASEDRISAANPLAEALGRRHYSVWLDHQVLSAGDKFSEEIRQGLAECHYGIVIVSPNFLRKDWPIRELDTLLAIERIDGRHRVVVVLHQVSTAEVQGLAPQLLRKALISSADGFERVCDEVLDRVVRSVDRDQLASLGNLDENKLPDFPGSGVVRCGNNECSWRDRHDIPIELKAFGPFFSLSRIGEKWCLTCTSCSTPAGWVTHQEAKQLAALARVGGVSASTTIIHK